MYADIALTLGDYLQKEYGPGAKDLSMDCCDMVVEKPLIAKNQDQQLFRMSGNVDWSTQIVKIRFWSVTPEGKKIADHANCSVKFGSASSWQKEWKRNNYLVRSRINQLHNGVMDGQSHKIKRGMAYKLFSSLVDYGTRYRGMEEVVLDSAQLEATAKVKFQTTEQDGNFYFSPYWIDSFGHLCGFTMNANDAVDSRTQVFVNHGWDSMRCSKSFSPECRYETYVKMQNVGGTMHAGDVYIFEGEDIVAVYNGVKVCSVMKYL